MTYKKLALGSRNNYPVSVSLPKVMLDKIDAVRGDVTRSRFILRLIERGLESTDKD